MRILHVVPTYFPATRYGGPIYAIHSLCKALVASGHEVHVYTTNVDGPGNSDVPLLQPVDRDGVKVWYFASKVLRRLYWSPSMGRCLRQNVGCFDIVHLHSVYLWPTWAAARAASNARIPYVLSPRGMLVKDLVRRKSRWLKSVWINLIESRNISNAAFIHVTSEAEREALQAFNFRIADIVVLPNGVEEPQSSTSENISADVAAAVAHQPSILFLGRLNWKKGLDRLLGALQNVHDGHLVIAGNDEEGYLPILQRLVADYALQQRISFIPRNVTGADKEVLFATAKVFVLPSYSENFGNAVVEAMMLGCPVVVTEEVGAADVVRQSQAGYVVTVEDLPDAINMLLADPINASRMGKQGGIWVREHLQWQNITAAMANEYRRVLNGVAQFSKPSQLQKDSVADAE